MDIQTAQANQNANITWLKSKGYSDKQITQFVNNPSAWGLPEFTRPADEFTGLTNQGVMHQGRMVNVKEITPENVNIAAGTAYAAPSVVAAQQAETTMQDLISKRFAPREAELERTLAAATGTTGGTDKGGYLTSLAKGRALLESEKAGETIDWDKFIKSLNLQKEQLDWQKYLDTSKIGAYQEYQDALKKQQPSGFEAFLENLMTNQGFGTGLSKLIFGL